jgi:hypothetical protein
MIDLAITSAKVTADFGAISMSMKLAGTGHVESDAFIPDDRGECRLVFGASDGIPSTDGQEPY